MYMFMYEDLKKVKPKYFKGNFLHYVLYDIIINLF